MSFKKIYIQGMSCVSCETIIGNELRKFPGLQAVEISCRSGLATVKHDQNFVIEEALAQIDRLGYKASLEPFGQQCTVAKKATPRQWFTSLLIAVALYLAYRLFLSLGLLDYLDVNYSNISLGVAFLIGIVASMSTCLMVVGTVIISFSAKYRSQGSGFYQTAVRPHVLFHAGRLASFFILGGLLGIIGSWFHFSQSFTVAFTIVVAVILIWLGLNIIGWLPSLTTLGFHLPTGIMKYWQHLENSNRPIAPILLGALTFFLPCGFTQSMQLFAIATGDFWSGAYTMLLFALGTAPVLLGLGIAATRFNNLKSVVFEKVLGLLVVVFALYVLSNGLAMAGVGFNVLGNKQTEVAAVGNETEQVITMTVKSSGFSPSSFELKQGVPVKWVIKGEQVTGCTSEIIVPDLGIKQKIKAGDNIIEFTPTKLGRVNFSCWMGMVKGFFTIKEAGAAELSTVKQTDLQAATTISDACVINENGSGCLTATDQPAAADAPVASQPVAAPPTSADSSASSDGQTVNMALTDNSYSPNVLYVKKGSLVRWLIDVQELSGCTEEIVLRGKYNISRHLQPGQNVIEFLPDQVGEIPFSCGMNMAKGKFIVTEDGTAAATPTGVNTAPPASGSCGGSGCGCGER